MSFITSGSNAHVTNVRNMLTSVGIEQTLTTENERSHIYYDGDLYVFAQNTPLKAVAGIWSENDPWHSGSNWYNTESGASFTAMDGKIILASGASGSMSSGDVIWMTYAHWNGLTDDNLNIIIDTNKIWLNAEFDMSWSYDITIDDSVEQLAILAVYTLSIRDAILQMNNSNAVQGGYSYDVGGLRVQTKLWGEGMSMESLFMRYDNLCQRMLNTLKYVYDGAPVVIVNRSRYSLPYSERAFPAASEALIDLGDVLITSYGDRIIIFNN